MFDARQGTATQKEVYAARTESIVARYKNGESLEEIGVVYGITRERVRQILERANCPRRAMTVTETFLKSLRRRQKVIDEKTLRKLYEKEKLTLREIRNRIETTNREINRSLDFHGIGRRSAAENKRLREKRPELTSERLYKLYVEENLTAATIAENSGYALQTVKSRLSLLGIKKSRRAKEGDERREKPKRAKAAEKQISENNRRIR